jgi:3-dehydroquinate dehydratase-2
MILSSVLVLNGPNLNLLGQREPEVYGSLSLDDHVAAVRAEAAKVGVAVEHIQSNSEGDIINAIHDAREKHHGIIINAGAFTHYSWAIHDALRSFEGHVVEVHLSNPGAREEFRHISVLSSVVSGTISGFGGYGYTLALASLIQLSQ